MPCNSGNFAPAGSGKCSQCQAGHIPDLGHGACEACGVGKFVKTGGDDCSECPLGTWAPAGSDHCTFQHAVIRYTMAYTLAGIMLAGASLAWCWWQWLRRRARKAIRVAMKSQNAGTLEEALKWGARVNASKKLLANGTKELKHLHSRYTDFHFFVAEVLRSGGMKLLKCSWLLEYQTSGQARFPRCQDIPPEGFWTAEEFESFQRLILTVAISYCWLHPIHCDPEGHHFETLCRALRLRLDVTGPARVEDIALFLDYCSLPQNGEKGDPNSPSPGQIRSPEEAQLFKTGLRQVNIPYAHQVIDTWMLQWTPRGMPTYQERGWPFFEECLSSLIKDASRLYDIRHMVHYDSWQLVHDHSTQIRRPPITPEEFGKLLEVKHFTNGETDLPFVKSKYQETFNDVVGGATELLFSSLGWGDPEAMQLLALFPYARCLETLCLGANRITTFGAMALARTADKCPTLRSMDLSRNDIDDPVRIREAWQQAGKDPRELRVGNVQIIRKPSFTAVELRPEEAPAPATAKATPGEKAAPAPVSEADDPDAESQQRSNVSTVVSL